MSEGLIPDYAHYTLDQLEDAALHINRERFPERAAILDAEIERRHRDEVDDLFIPAAKVDAIGSDPLIDEPLEAAPNRSSWLPVAGAVILLVAVLSLTGLANPDHGAIASHVVIGGLFTAAGIMLLRRRRAGLWFAIPGAFLYMMSVQVGRVWIGIPTLTPLRFVFNLNTGNVGISMKVEGLILLAGLLLLLLRTYPEPERQRGVGEEEPVPPHEQRTKAP
ncbi:MAG: hypothetical protein JST22_07200 [Bacteroidetes bacterium]|nr:hypothetical protein [Bacteroidota bacterium]